MKTPRRIGDDLVGAVESLNVAQKAIDDAMLLAALVVTEADGKPAAALPVDFPAETLARRMLNEQRYAELTSYLLEPAMKYGRPSRGGLLRALTGWGS